VDVDGLMTVSSALFVAVDMLAFALLRLAQKRVTRCCIYNQEGAWFPTRLIRPSPFVTHVVTDRVPVSVTHSLHSLHSLTHHHSNSFLTESNRLGY